MAFLQLRDWQKLTLHVKLGSSCIADLNKIGDDSFVVLEHHLSCFLFWFTCCLVFFFLVFLLLSVARLYHNKTSKFMSLHLRITRHISRSKSTHGLLPQFNQILSTFVFFYLCTKIIVQAEICLWRVFLLFFGKK